MWGSSPDPLAVAGRRVGNNGRKGRGGEKAGKKGGRKGREEKANMRTQRHFQKLAPLK